MATVRSCRRASARLWNMETHGSIPEDVGRQLLRDDAGSLDLLTRLGVGWLAHRA